LTQKLPDKEGKKRATDSWTISQLEGMRIRGVRTSFSAHEKRKYKRAKENQNRGIRTGLES